MAGYSAKLPPPDFNMAQYCLAPRKEREADKLALAVLRDPKASEPAESWTFGACEDATLRIAGGLIGLGLTPGDRLMIRLENTSDYALMFFGAIAAGLVPLPASAALSAREVTYLLEDSGARAIALTHRLPVGDIPSDVMVLEEKDVSRLLGHPERAAYASTKAEDPAFLVYTSGTTADPKGVLHGHRSVWGRRPMYQGWYGITPQDRMLHAGAFNWTYTLGTGLSDPWANGAAALIYTGEGDPAIWPHLMELHNATQFAAVPSVYRQILKYSDIEAHDISSLRHGLTAGEHLPEKLETEWIERTGKLLYEALGMSELSTFISSSPSVPVRPGAVGKPQAGRHVEIVAIDGGTDPLPRGETGLIAAHRSDPGLMLGYWNRPELEREVFRGDWFLGGDLGSMDGDGYIFHEGRNDDLMNALGYRVSPQEVEQVLTAHPDIAEVAATEVRVREDLCVIGAFIVPRDGAPRKVEPIRAFAEQRLAQYKVPKEFVFVDALPRTANGKIKRAQLRRSHSRSGG